MGLRSQFLFESILVILEFLVTCLRTHCLLKVCKYVSLYTCLVAEGRYVNHTELSAKVLKERLDKFNRTLFKFYVIFELHSCTTHILNKSGILISNHLSLL